MLHALTMLCVLVLTDAAEARTVGDDKLGFHVSSDPTDTVGDRYRVSVEHCNALTEAMAVLRDRHGWRISVETPVLTDPSEWGEITFETGEHAMHCPRTVAFATDYSSADPLLATREVIDAYNASEPPFTAEVQWCGDVLCVRPVAVRTAGGVYTTVTARSDQQLVSVGATRDDVLDEPLSVPQANDISGLGRLPVDAGRGK